MFFGASKVLGVIFFVATAFIYTFLDGLVPETTFKENNKTELVKKIKEYSKTLQKLTKRINALLLDTKMIVKVQ